ncbi:lipopolysaccharide biosynthesis protein [Corynebacterium sp. HS2168-gen11]|uniref:lipopolysaccharide biosynthesis protein n=1 Tax=Corynebacterium sp. HS2168-gen11 TaxID=2974027 RepID=UPI00216AC8A9|nr:hypothetical protein [Corynebacterium sp. HS2168-gen11]MCS4535606.1 hypothetical protein [Corynebacterium sp. HS2168-gen11]
MTVHDDRPSSLKVLSIATVVAGLSGFAVILLAARTFDSDTFRAGEFAAYWGFFFAATGILTGLTQETTRAVRTQHTTAAQHSQQKLARPFVVGVVLSALTFALVLISSPVWLHRLVSEQHTNALVLLAVGLASYGIQATLAGLISGHHLWSRLAALIMLDTASRMVLAGVAWWFNLGLLAFFIVTVLGAVSWIVILALYADVRAILAATADVAPREFLTQAGYAMTASGATAIVITGFPTIVKLTHPEAAVGAAISYAVILTRAPLLLPLQQFQSALIVRFVEHQHNLLRALLRPAAVIWAVGIGGAGLAWLIGPWLFRILLPASFLTSGALLAMLTIGATCTASLMLTGTAALAVNQHQLYVTGWVVATIVTIGIMFVPLPLSTVSVLSLIGGQTLGLGIHIFGLLRVAKQATPVQSVH